MYIIMKAMKQSIMSNDIEWKPPQGSDLEYV